MNFSNDFVNHLIAIDNENQKEINIPDDNILIKEFSKALENIKQHDKLYILPMLIENCDKHFGIIFTRRDAKIPVGLTSLPEGKIKGKLILNEKNIKTKKLTFKFIELDNTYASHAQQKLILKYNSNYKIKGKWLLWDKLFPKTIYKMHLMNKSN